MEDKFRVEIDLSFAKTRAEQVRDELIFLRAKYNLSDFEYCKLVSITPLKIPYSHPEIVLNTFIHGELALLSSYLHEQMHWYLTWYSHAKPDGWESLREELKRRYPDVPPAIGGGARDEDSTYLHLIINWLEVETVNHFVRRDEAENHVKNLPYYHWIYETVLTDWISLEQLYHLSNLLPIKLAPQMSDEELKIASSFDEKKINVF